MNSTTFYARLRNALYSLRLRLRREILVEEYRKKHLHNEKLPSYTKFEGFKDLSVAPLLVVEYFDQMKKIDPNTRSFYSNNVPIEILDYLITDELLEFVSGYLGADWRMDNAYVKNIGSSHESHSSAWHTDNCGTRLKAFFIFGSSHSGIPTMLDPTRTSRLGLRLLVCDILRFIKPTMLQGSRSGEVSLVGEEGDLVVFDTDMFHRGGYSKASAERYCVCIEFMSANHSDALWDLAPCGPHKGMDGVRLGSARGLPKRRYLDEKLIRRIGDAWYYCRS